MIGRHNRAVSSAIKKVIVRESYQILKFYEALAEYLNLSEYLIAFEFFCFSKTNFDVFTIFSELSGLKGNVLFMEIYTSMKILKYISKQLYKMDPPVSHQSIL